MEVAERVGRVKFCDASEQSFDVQPVCAVSVLRAWRGREALLISLGATAGGLAVTSVRAGHWGIEGGHEVSQTGRHGLASTLLA